MTMRIRMAAPALTLLTLIWSATSDSWTPTRAQAQPSAEKLGPGAERGGVPPTARAIDVVDDYFGIKVADPYRWMESGGDELTRWLSAQQAYTESRLTAIPARKRLATRVRELSLGTSSVTVGAMAGPYHFYTRIAAGEQLPKLIVAGPDDKERVLVDPAQRRGQGSHVSLNIYQPSFDG
jgi:prolyl oligopeptidase